MMKKNIGKKINAEEMAYLIIRNPYWFIDNPPIVIKAYKDGRKRLFVKIGDKNYYVIQNSKVGKKDEWYEVINGSTN